MTANYHTHTRRCRHAAGEDREYIEKAIAAGIKVLGFSDHCPWVFPDSHVSGTRMEPSEVEGYFTSLTALRDEYASDIKIYIGFEAEYIPELMEAQDRLLADYPVDYMILGQHFTVREPFGPYTGSPSSDAEELYRYTDLVIEAMESGRYKYVAHPDLINYIGTSPDDDRLEQCLRRICTYLKEKDVPVEINMLGVSQGRHYTSERFLRIAQECGNSVIIGCDAHDPEVFSDAANIAKCRAMAEKFGLPLVERLPGLD